MGVVCISSTKIWEHAERVSYAGSATYSMTWHSVRLVGNHAIAPGLFRSDHSNVRRMNQFRYRGAMFRRFGDASRYRDLAEK